MSKFYIYFLAILLLVTVLFVATKMSATRIDFKQGSARIKVSSSFYSLYFFTREIGRDKIDLINLVPAGAEPHDFEPSAKDLASLENSKLLILNGVGFEVWGERVTKSLQEMGVTVVHAAQGLASVQTTEGGKKISDPHVWLSPRLAAEEAQKIADALIVVDPKNSDFYNQNNITLQGKFINLDNDFKNGLNECQKKDIITSHDAFAYLAQDYGFRQIAITGLSPDLEPSPQQLAEISTLGKKEGLKYIFFETLVSPRLAQTLASEIGAQTLVFNPLEGLSAEETSQGQDYFSIQRQNLRNLRLALECK